MEHESFDALTRSVATGGETRRAMLRSLAGGALGILAARLGLTDDAEAKQKRKRRPEPKRQDTLQAEGKGKKKGKGKGKKKPSPKPQPSCGDGKKPCPDGGCVSQALCCPGERMCAGGVCQTGCCPDERQCYGTDMCVGAGECCPAEKKCGDECYPRGDCCPDQKLCPSDVCVGKNECCPDAIPPLCGDCEEVACEGGELVCRPEEGPCCPAGAMVCPGAPELDWPLPGGWIHLPAGCCPPSKIAVDPNSGRTLCAAPWSGGSGWWCD
jgi:hypothetical protein